MIKASAYQDASSATYANAQQLTKVSDNPATGRPVHPGYWVLMSRLTENRRKDVKAEKFCLLYAWICTLESM